MTKLFMLVVLLLSAVSGNAALDAGLLELLHDWPIGATRCSWLKKHQ